MIACGTEKLWRVGKSTLSCCTGGAGLCHHGQDVENWASPEGCQRAAQAYYQAICQYFGTDPQA